MARWHDTVRIDRMNRPYMPVKQARTVRATVAAEAAAATTIRKYRINLTLLLPLLLFITATSGGSVERESTKSNRYRVTVQ